LDGQRGLSQSGPGKLGRAAQAFCWAFYSRRGDGKEPSVSDQRSVAAAYQFTAFRSRRIVPGAGHNLPHEKPLVFADAVLELMQRASFATSAAR
jgi:pimeloyl-ACP methyl ester carboxylesterase